MDSSTSFPTSVLDTLRTVSLSTWLILFAITTGAILVLVLRPYETQWCQLDLPSSTRMLTHYLQGYAGLHLVAPTPRASRRSEKTYITVLPDGSVSEAEALPCWYDQHCARKDLAVNGKISAKEAFEIDPAEIFMSVVVPAYNEEDRLRGMLQEAVQYLSEAYTDTPQLGVPNGKGPVANGKGATSAEGRAGQRKGWEIIVVSDGSSDKTVDTALSFARAHQLSSHPPTPVGPWSSVEGSKPRSSALRIEAKSTHIPHGSIRVVSLEENRGKGGAVTHGMRHIRGEYVVFADADGASRFSDLGRLVDGCERVKDTKGRAVGIGSRAHLVGSEAVVKVSKSTESYSFTLDI